MIIGFKKKPSSSRYFSGLIVVCVFIGFAAVQISSKLFGAPNVTAPAKSMVHAHPISVHVIDGDTISFNDGLANVRLVGFNAPKQEAGRDARQSGIRE
jgi:endonuclease YncB( thermonuclease family)